MSHYGSHGREAMPPPPGRTPPTVMSTRTSVSTTEFRRRTEEVHTIVELQTGMRAMSMSTPTPSLRKSERFSVEGGKRVKSITDMTRSRSTYSITLESRWDEGAFRWCHKGKYTPDPRVPGHDGGPQNGQLCVLKEFKTGTVFETSYFSKDIGAVTKASSFIEAFNQEMVTTRNRGSFIDHNRSGVKKVYMIQAKVWENVYPDATGRKAKKIVEPMLEGEFIKFNSNNGYTDGAELLQALSHFSYQHSQGKHLLCDLQGGHYSDCYILTDPVIMSEDNSKEFGSGDLGKEGIENFFAHHRCNHWCRHWRKPAQVRVSTRIPAQRSSSLSLNIGTRQSDAERERRLQEILAGRR